MYTWFGLLDSYKGTQYVGSSICLSVCLRDCLPEYVIVCCCGQLSSPHSSLLSHSHPPSLQLSPTRAVSCARAVGKFNYLLLISSFVFCAPLLYSYLLYGILNWYIYIANLRTHTCAKCTECVCLWVREMGIWWTEFAFGFAIRNSIESEAINWQSSFLVTVFGFSVCNREGQ